MMLCEDKPARLLVVFLGKALYGIPLAVCGRKEINAGTFKIT